MDKIRVTKEFGLEMAHALYGYDGPCKNIHGHSYRLSVCVTGKIIHTEDHPKNGMVIDFSDLKKIVQSKIIGVFDHALVLNAGSPHKKFAEKDDLFEKIILVDYQPTCENMTLDFVNRIRTVLPGGLTLHHLRLSETSSSFAEWYAEDNAHDND